jgi:hypothetical protein
MWRGNGEVGGKTVAEMTTTQLKALIQSAVKEALFVSRSRHSPLYRFKFECRCHSHHRHHQL